MSTRPTQDWSPLEWSTDPIPGDPDVVATTASRFGDTANSVDSAALNLRHLNSTQTQSDAVGKVVSSSMELANQLEEVRDRYSQANQALASYAPALRDAQAKSLAALNAATAASQQARMYDASAQDSYQGAKRATTPDQQSQWVAAMNQAVVRRNSARGAVETAKGQLKLAIRDRDDAARSAQATIDGAIDGSPLNDSGWDKFKHFIKPALDVIEGAAKFVWKHIDAIALALTALAFIFSWVPGLDVVLAVLATAARALSTLKAGLQAARDVATGITTGNWKPLLVSGPALLLSLVGGKVASKAIEKIGERRVVSILSKAASEKFTAAKSELATLVTRLRGGGAQTAERGIAASALHEGPQAAARPSTIDRILAGESIPSARTGSPPLPGHVSAIDNLRSITIPKRFADLPLVPNEYILRLGNLPTVADQYVGNVIDDRWMSAFANKHRIEPQVCVAP